MIHSGNEVGSDLGEVLFDRCGGVRSGDDNLLKVLIEDVPNDLDEQIGFGVQQGWCLSLLSLSRNFLPLLLKSLDVVGQLLLGRTLGCGADNDSRAFRKHLLQNRLQACPFLIRQLSRDSIHGATGNENEVSTRQADLAGKPRPLVSHGVFGHLDQHGVTGLEG